LADQTNAKPVCLVLSALLRLVPFFGIFMSNYSAVQFISWEIHTGPFVTGSTPEGQTGYYSGLVSNSASDFRVDVHGQCFDIEARLLFVVDAISKSHFFANTQSSILKVFIAPEFLFRGAGGAYLHDLINGWDGPAPAEFNLTDPLYNKKWKGLFGNLQAIVNDQKYEDWLFVFGTAISASFPASQIIDEKYLLDPTKPGEIYNTALIQKGGAGNTGVNYVSRKHYISGIDFLRYYSNPNNLVHTIDTVIPADPDTIIPVDVMGISEGGAVFNIPNINDASGKPLVFGIEVCLDHKYSGGNYVNHFGRLRSADQNVKIQLVPSCGMTLQDASIRLTPAAGPTPHSFAINCDGLSNLTDHSYGSHTQIWNGQNGDTVPPSCKLVEASSGAALAGTQVAAVMSSTTLRGTAVAATNLWNNGDKIEGAGHVRVCTPLML
jgi:hypothetical protein